MYKYENFVSENKKIMSINFQIFQFFILLIEKWKNIYLRLGHEA
jgi:hypothetical protein